MVLVVRGFTFGNDTPRPAGCQLIGRQATDGLASAAFDPTYTTGKFGTKSTTTGVTTLKNKAISQSNKRQSKKKKCEKIWLEG